MKDVQIEIKGRKLLFGRGGVLQHLQDVVNRDPFEWMSEMNQRFTKGEDGKWHIIAMIEDIVAYAYAGLNLYADEHDEEPISIEKTKRWVRTLPIEQYSEIINAAVESMVVKESENGLGEHKTQPVS